MSRNYDNWKRLVEAVIKRQQIWQLCHQHSRTPSICSEASSSDFSSSNYFQESDVMLENNKNSPVLKLVSLKSVWRRRELGRGKFGTSILTKLWSDQVNVSDHEFLGVGTELVMKKLLGDVRVTEAEFKIVFGNCSHENVFTPRAYYFSSRGNYIFNDYHSLGSVYDLLRGNRNGRLNWESRLKIAIGAARGIAHIHKQYDGKLAHGNVRSSNIFLNSNKYGCVSDFGLAGILESPGKWASECEVKVATQESDVYSFGVVLLQLLLGKSPVKRHGFWEDIHLVKWAHSMTPEDWSSKLFDQSLWSNELSNYQCYKGGILCDESDLLDYEEELELQRKTKVEMLEMLQVAMRCLAVLPQDRPKMFEVAFMLENIGQQSKSHLNLVIKIKNWRFWDCP